MKIFLFLLACGGLAPLAGTGSGAVVRSRLSVVTNELYHPPIPGNLIEYTQEYLLRHAKMDTACLKVFASVRRKPILPPEHLSPYEYSATQRKSSRRKRRNRRW